MRRLTFEEIAAITYGCESVCHVDGAVEFHRLPDALAVNYRKNEGSRIRLECASCVRLRFYSTTRRIRIGLRYGRAARPLFLGVITINGEQIGVFGGGERSERWEGTISIPAIRKPGLIELWLPHLVRADLEFLEIDDDCECLPAETFKQRWLALGDSITQGMTATLPTRAWVARAAVSLGVDVRNYGIGGGRLEGFLADADQGWLYDLLTVAYGINDFSGSRRPEELTADAIRLLKRQAEAHPAATRVLITPIPAPGRNNRNAAGRSLEDYREALRYAARGAPLCTVIEGPSLVPDDPRWFVDGVHPNDEGMNVFALNFVSAILMVDPQALRLGRQAEVKGLTNNESAPRHDNRCHLPNRVHGSCSG